MKIIRYQDPSGQIRFAAETSPGRHHVIRGDLYGSREVTSEVAQVSRLLAPIVPTQILGIGLNYRHHAAESGMKAPTFPVLFFKGLNTLQDPGAPIELPQKLASTEVDYECELAVVIGKTCKNVSKEKALDYVLGYTCANDVSARDWQIKQGGGQWSRGKSFDTFSPLGPCLVTTESIPDPSKLKIKTVLNGETVQDWYTGDMIFDVPTIIEFLSGSTTLIPGTVILTGTPHGVGMAAKPTPRWLKAGDSVTIEVDAIGALTNPVVNEKI